MPRSPAIRREEGVDVGGTSGTSAIAQLYHQLTGDDLRRGCDLRQDKETRQRIHSGGPKDEDYNDDEDIEDEPSNEPCDLRLFTPDTCLREMSSPLTSADFSAHSSSTMVPYLGGAVLPVLAETLISNMSKFKTSPGGSSSTGTAGGMPTSSATIPSLRNIRTSASAVPGSSATGGGTSSGGSGGGGSGGSNQTTPGGAYSCQRCGNSYARPHSLNRHIRFECGVEPKFECPVCHKKSKHKHNLVLHMRTHQQR